MSLKIFFLIIAISPFITPNLTFGACSREVRVTVDSDEQDKISQGREADHAMTDFLNLVFEDTGCKPKYILVPRARMYRMFFETKEADFFKPASQTAEREKVAVFIPLVRYQIYLAYKSNVQHAPKNINELLKYKDWKGVTVRTYSYGDEWDRYKEQLIEEKRIDFVDSRESMFSMLNEGRVHFAVVPSIYAWSQAQIAKNPATLKMEKLQGLRPYVVGIYLSKWLPPQDLETLKKSILRFNQEGKFISFLKKYYPKEVFNREVLPIEQ